MFIHGNVCLSTQDGTPIQPDEVTPSSPTKGVPPSQGRYPPPSKVGTPIQGRYPHPGMGTPPIQGRYPCPGMGYASCIHARGHCFLLLLACLKIVKQQIFLYLVS